MEENVQTPIEQNPAEEVVTIGASASTTEDATPVEEVVEPSEQAPIA